jgi:hypothetical protein
MDAITRGSNNVRLDACCWCSSTMRDQQCVSGVCTAGCLRNKQCPLFDECKDGECIEVGCNTARDCFFATKNPLSECMDKSASRALLGLASVVGSDRAVCRAPNR